MILVIIEVNIANLRREMPKSARRGSTMSVTVTVAAPAASQEMGP